MLLLLLTIISYPLRSSNMLYFVADKKALAYLRRTERLNRLVFLSCNPKAAISNFLTLSRPASKAYRGVPYVPVRAVPVDMFPHTSHCELVVYFERYNGTSLL